jgi:4-hydroxy-3-polyprenylbenzoate decarboxylase
MGRYTIVVDDDIDVYNLDEVLWALCTRSDPRRSITVLDRCWSGPLDPIITAEHAGMNSRAIIDACRPWEWRDRFPREIRMDPTIQQRVIEKWGPLLFG